MKKQPIKKFFTYDGYLIEDGDLLRCFHFMEGRTKHYLYHVVREYKGTLYAVHYRDRAFPKKRNRFIGRGTCTLARYFKERKHGVKEAEILAWNSLAHYTHREKGKPS